MSEDCLFCRILKNEIPSKKVFENEKVYAFKDIHPQAPVHVLFIHKEHTKDIGELIDQDPRQLQDLFLAIRQFSVETKIDDKGIRIMTNWGKSAGQTVFHTHFHVLSGKL